MIWFDSLFDKLAVNRFSVLLFFVFLRKSFTYYDFSFVCGLTEFETDARFDFLVFTELFSESLETIFCIECWRLLIKLTYYFIALLSPFMVPSCSRDFVLYFTTFIFNVLFKSSNLFNSLAILSLSDLSCWNRFEIYLLSWMGFWFDSRSFCCKSVFWFFNKLTFSLNKSMFSFMREIWSLYWLSFFWSANVAISSSYYYCGAFFYCSNISVQLYIICLYCDFIYLFSSLDLFA